MLVGSILSIFLHVLKLSLCIMHAYSRIKLRSLSPNKIIFIPRSLLRSLFLKEFLYNHALALGSFKITIGAMS